jgi:hypothetical protein
MKIIFLDVDGVLNYQLMWAEKRQADRYKELPKDAPKGTHDICPDKIGLLNMMIADTGAKVVISSSWRMGRTVEDLRELFEWCGFEGEIIGKTPRLWFNHDQEEDYRSTSVPRGCEIKSWLENNKGILGEKMSKLKYVIFDDDSDMLWWQRNAFFWVDPYCGLTPNIIYKATRHLNS